MEAAIPTECTVKPSQAISCVRKVLMSGRVPMLHGSPAIGKSSVVHFIANAKKFLLIDLRLGQLEPPDLMGFPHIDLIKFKAGYVPMDTFPVEGDEIPEGYVGWIIFLDELTSAEPAVQAAAYKLILDRMVGNKKLHPLAFIVGAGNLESDNAIVYPMSTALQTRMTHFKMVLDMPEWLSWAMDNKVDHRITDYIQYRPDNLFNFDPNHSDLTYASPRSWHMNSDCLTQGCGGNILDPDFIPISSGNVTYGVTRDFLTFCEYYQHLPKLDEVLAKPETIVVPEEPGILYALTGMLGRNANKNNIDALMKFVTRIPTEFQVVTMRGVMKVDRDLKRVESVADWNEKNIATLF